jgi:hypothetical protein
MVAECERYDIDSALAEEPTPQVALGNRSVVKVCPDFCVNDQVVFLGMGSGEGVHFPFPSSSL